MMLPVPEKTVHQIYTDLLQPAFRQFGSAGESIAKTICLLNLPFMYGALKYELLVERFQRSLKKIPDKNLTSPPVNVIFQISEKLMSMPEDDPISEMYVQLLSSCSNIEYTDSVHPAFVNLICQISGDEALFIDILAQRELSVYIKRDESWEPPTETELDALLVAWDGAMLGAEPIREAVIHPEQFRVPKYFFTYLEHLKSLGIIEYINGPENLLTPEFVYSLEGHGYWFITLTKFGRLFYGVCINDPDVFSFIK